MKYFIKCLIISIAQLLCLIFGIIFINNSFYSGVGGGIVATIVSIGAYIGLAIWDANTRNFSFFKCPDLLVCLIVAPIKPFFYVYTVTKKLRNNEDLDDSKKYIDDCWLNRAYFILFNADAGKVLGSDRKINKVNEHRENVYKENTRKQVEQVRYNEKSNSFMRNDGVNNVKLMMFGCFQGLEEKRKYYTIYAHNKDNSFNDNNNYYYFVEGLYINNVKMNSRPFKDHVHFSLRPGSYTIKLHVKIVQKFSNYINYVPDTDYFSNRSTSTIIKSDECYELKLNVIDGYKYDLGFIIEWVAIGQYIVDGDDITLGNDLIEVKKEFIFEQMSEEQLKSYMKIDRIFDGIDIKDVMN